MSFPLQVRCPSLWPYQLALPLSWDCPTGNHWGHAITNKTASCSLPRPPAARAGHLVTTPILYLHLFRLGHLDLFGCLPFSLYNGQTPSLGTSACLPWQSLGRLRLPFLLSLLSLGPFRLQRHPAVGSYRPSATLCMPATAFGSRKFPFLLHWPN